MQKPLSPLASVEFQQCSKFVVHDFSHTVHGGHQGRRIFNAAS
jgi:hypothetical protein